MNEQNQPSSSAADDAKMELAMAASTAERANKPRWIVVLGASLLAITVIFSLVSLSSRANVQGRVNDERLRTKKITDLKRQLDDENAKLAARGGVHDDRTGGNIERSAQAAGLVLTGSASDSTETTLAQVGLQKRRYAAKAVNQDPSIVLNWLKTMQERPETASLEISKLIFRPGGGGTATGSPGWNIDVDFSRWEKK